MVSPNNIAINSFILVVKYGKSRVVKVDSISEGYIHYIYQNGHGKTPDSAYCKYDNSVIMSIPFDLKILELEGWKKDEFDENRYIDPTGQISIYKSEELSTYPFTVHIDNSDMITIGHMNFQYYHELQSFCNICKIPLNFKFGTVNYLYNESKNV